MSEGDTQMAQDHAGRAGRMRRATTVAVAVGAALLTVLGAMGVAATALGMAAAPAGAAGSTYTWTGTDANTNPAWSDANNWSGGSAPSGSVGTLVFPTLSGCSANGCASQDDVTVATGAVDVTGGSYYLLGLTSSGTSNPLTVGSGGITVSGDATAMEMLMPLDLSASQTWSVSAADNLSVNGSLSGSSPALGVDVSGESSVLLGPNLSSAADDEIGPVTVTGADTSDTGLLAGENGGLLLESVAGSGVSLDATDGQPVTVDDAILSGTATVGPVALHGGDLSPGQLVADSPTGDLDVDGNVSLDASSAFVELFPDESDVAGTDYGELISTGTVSLGGAVLDGGMADSSCDLPALGTTYTLVQAGSITGHFSSVDGAALSDGGTAPLVGDTGDGCQASTGLALQVEYDTTSSPATVTATVVTASGSGTSGAASTTTLAASATTVTTGKAVTYTATVAPAPTGGTVAFDDGGTAITGCTAQPVATSGADAGQATCTVTYTSAGTHQVTAAFSGTGSGASAEAGSTSTAVTVTVTSSGSGSGGSGSGGSGSSGSGGSGGAPNGQGYAEVTRDGWVYVFGAARSFGSLPSDGVHVDDVVGIAPTADGGGYWLAGADGGVFGFGDAAYHGSLPADGVHVDDVIGLQPSSDGGGYWMVGADGGVFGFGDAAYHGSLPADKVSVDDVVGLAPTPDGRGYWMVGRDGGVFGFGDAGYYGSLPADKVSVDDIVGIAPTHDGRGYWLVGADGGVFAFGDARYAGAASASGAHDVVALVPTPDGGGYWEVGADGGIFAYGDAQYLGSLPAFGVHADDVVAATR